MGLNGEIVIPEEMDIQTVQSKRRRFSTGTGTDNCEFSRLSIVDKLSHMFVKLNNLEQANRTVVNIAQCVSQNSAQISQMNSRMNSHEQFLKL